MSEELWDVAIVGAGAAGMLAAARAAERGLRTLLLEKNRKVGAKILMSGGSRCNLTQATDVKGIVKAYGAAGRFLYSALTALAPPALVDLIESEGVPTKVEATGKIFPVSDRSVDVQQALLKRALRCGAQLATEQSVESLGVTPQGFEIAGPGQRWRARQVILTTGGQSYPGCGTTGDGYAWCRAFGHTVVATRPALVPLRSPAAWIRDLSGITLPDVKVQVRQPTPPQILAEDRGSLLFTHVGLSGPVVLNVSRAVSSHATPQELLLQVDLLPDRSEDELRATLQQAIQQSGQQLLVNRWSEWLPRRLVEAVLTLAEIPLDRRLAECRKVDRTRLVDLTQRLPIPVSGTLGFEKAEVTAGGVALNEVDSRTMQSKLVPGLYLAGEILDLDGPIGGYNFQAAFSTGWLAGSSVSASFPDKRLTAAQSPG